LRVDNIEPDSSNFVTISNLAQVDSSVYADTADYARNAATDTVNSDSINVDNLKVNNRADVDTVLFSLAFKVMVDPDSAILSAYRINQLLTAELAGYPTFAEEMSSIDSAITAIDSTKITDNKLGISDINSLSGILGEKATAAELTGYPTFTQEMSSIDSAITAIDSTKITDNKLGISDINSLSSVLDSKATTAELTGYPTFTQEVSSIDSAITAIDSTKITDNKLGVSDINSLSGTLDSKAAKSANETITGTWGFDETISGSIDGNAATATKADSTDGGAQYADRANYADTSGLGPIATNSDRGTVIVGSGLSVTAGGTISVAGAGGSAYADSIVKVGVRVTGDSVAMEAQVKSTVQEYIYIPSIGFVADTTMTIDQNDSMDVFLDTEGAETVIVARAKESAVGGQNLVFQAFVENPQTFLGVDSLSVTYNTTHASADSNKLKIYVGTLNRFTGAVTITDSSAEVSSAAYTSQALYIGDNSVGKDDVIIVRFRTWSINESKMVRLKRMYLVY